jgi:lipopolysaccharide assembly protein A
VVAAVVALLLVVFAITNRDPVEVNFWPFPVTIQSALSLIVLGAVVIAFLIGQFFAWLGAQRWRHEARVKQRRIEALERELAATQTQLTSADELAGLRGDSKSKA